MSSSRAKTLPQPTPRNHQINAHPISHTAKHKRTTDSKPSSQKISYFQSKLSLLALHAELCNYIWAYSLTTPTHILTSDASTRRFDVSAIGAGLLTTCHSIFEETRYLPLRLNRLSFAMPGRRSRSFTALLAKLRRLEEDFGCPLEVEVRLKEEWILRL
ncbi:hypothetical protein CC86DRAFT_20876 [Ophiobolus disseminans]|uniref:Uncharacterized protein n=1 Tax=Ophiobolus disseminans TaxID=1469910 RepID=A0A6A7A1Q7_9PLEO|nr:hypothetical protein CC86DRAFT_20876 [Ophiobolus disseminans]